MSLFYGVLSLGEGEGGEGKPDRVFPVFIGPRYTWGPIYGSECLELTDRCADLSDVTLADEDTKQY